MPNKNLQTTVILLILLILGFVFTQAGFAEETVLNIYGSQVRPVMLAAPAPFSGNPAPSADWRVAYDTRLRKALGFHGALKPLDRSAELADDSPVSAFKAQVWRAAGAEMLLKSEIRAFADRVEADVYLFDVGSAESVLSRRFKTTNLDALTLADAVAGAVVENLLGIRSPFEQPIAFQYREPNQKWRELYVTDWAGENVKKRTNNQKLILHPSYIPGSDFLLAVGYRDRMPALRFFDLAKATERVLLNSTSTMHGTAAFRDKERVAFAWEQNKNTDIYLLNINSGQWEQLTQTPAADLSPTVSPDGSKIAFVSDRRGNPYIFLLDIASKKVEPLILEGSYLGEPDWSPDGKRLAFVRRDRGTGFAIWSYEFDTQQLEQITADLGDSLESPTWGPDSRTIIYSILHNNSYDIWKVDRQLKQPQPLTNLPGDARMPAWRAN